MFLARDIELDRQVALKVLRVGVADPEADRRLRREAMILARLEHPGIVPIHDAGTLADGRVYYVMKLVRGVRLDEVARATPRPELLRLFLRICDAVGFAHAQGIIHRDLKPGNIMVGSFGEVLVLDWGIARMGKADEADKADGAGKADRADEADVDDTAPGTVLGTPGFMAPEQARGDLELVDARSDVFSLGAVLRFLASGLASPHSRVDFELRPLEAIWRRAMSPIPGDRYESAGALAEDVARFLDQRPVAAYQEPMHERLRRLIIKYQTPILLVLAYLAMRILFLVTRGL